MADQKIEEKPKQVVEESSEEESSEVSQSSRDFHLTFKGSILNTIYLQRVLLLIILLLGRLDSVFQKT